MGRYDCDDYDNTYGGVCLNCGSAKCGYYGGCEDKDDEEKTKPVEPKKTLNSESISKTDDEEGAA
jgi:hypothetical protein